LKKKIIFLLNLNKIKFIFLKKICKIIITVIKLKLAKYKN
jgi:hypothetical protein